MTANRSKADVTSRPEFFGDAAFRRVALPVTTFAPIALPEREKGATLVERAIVVDYGLGNLNSVVNALGRLRVAAEVSCDPDTILRAEALILPGVGAFGRAMSNLRDGRLEDLLSEAVLRRKRPTLGICLGMQIMAESSSELGSHRGLGWVSGQVSRIEGPARLPVPHVGWNEVAASPQSILFSGIPSTASVYFDHSFALAQCPDQVAQCDYGGPFVAAIERDNLMAVQFHPEKSQLAGQRLLANFLSFAARHPVN